AAHRQAQVEMLGMKYLSDLDVGYYVLNSGIKDDPNWKNLFGSEDHCGCQHCKSVYSPAAYLADCLHFLEKNDAFDELNRRRPDIQHLLLNCENANTAMPYIDLVNEVLEAAVEGEHNTAKQTTLSTRELVANPEHTRSQAYETLKTAIYPWKASFDLDNRLGHIYLKHLGVQPHRLIELFGTQAEGLEKERTKAILGLNETDWTLLLADEYEANEEDYWGLKNGESIDNTAGIRFFLDKSQLDLDQLTELTKSRFVNQGGHISLNYEDPCSLDNAEILNLDSDKRKRITQLIRLQEKLGVSIRTMDHLLYALGEHHIDETVLSELAQLVLWQQRFGLSYEELIGWVDILPTKSLRDKKNHRELYEKIFLSQFEDFEILHENSYKDIRFLFEPGNDEEYSLNGAGETSVMIRNYVAGALQLTTAELSALIDHLGLGVLSPESLSALYRYASLSRTLKVSIHDLITLQQIFLPDTENAMQEVLATVELIDEVRETGFRVAEVLYLFGKNPEGELHENRKIEILQEIREALWKFDHQGEENGQGENQLSPITIEDLIFEKLSVAFDLNRNVVRDLLARADEGGSYLEHLHEESKKPYLNFFMDNTFRGRNLDAGLPVPQVEPGQFPQLETLLDLLNRIALILDKFNGKEAHYESLISPEGKANWIDLNAFQKAGDFPSLPGDFIRLMNISRVIKATPDTDTNIFEILTTPPAQLEEWKEKVAQLFDREDLSSQLELMEIDDFSDPESYLRIKEALELEEHLGFSLSEYSNANGFSWATADLSHRQVNEIIQVAKAKYGDERWQTVTRQLRDQVREEQRDALLSYATAHLINQDNLERLSTPEHLYAYFLIDTEMSACTITSRLKLAISSVQLYVQRCLMNLEAKVDLSAINELEQKEWQEWAWRKNYRVWEANRKVFLYPENWLEPEWRDDKTPFFEELEAQLLQNEIGTEQAEKAYLDYLLKLEAVSNMEIMAICEAETVANVVSGYYIFGRTYGEPKELYFRKYTIRTGSFSAWERIEVGFEGDHLLPAMHKGKLHLFWPVLEEKTEPQNPDQEGRYDASTPNRSVKIAWCSFYNRKWSGKKVTNEYIESNSETIYLKYENDRVILYKNGRTAELNFYFGPGAPNLSAHFGNEDLQTELVHLGAFNFSSSKITTSPPNEDFDLRISQSFLQFKSNGINDDAKLRALSVENQKLQVTPGFEKLYYRGEWFINNLHPHTTLISSSDITYPSVGIFPFIVQNKRISVLFKDGKIIPLQNTLYPLLRSRINSTGLSSSIPHSEWQSFQEDSFVISEYISINSDFVLNVTILNNSIPFYSSPAFSQYHWELFFHIPMHVANRLRQDQKFEEALEWFHHVFNPTSSEAADSPEKFWRFLPFREFVSTTDGSPNSIRELMNLLNAEEDQEGIQEFERQVREWEQNPFSPHTVARSRIIAYMKWVVMRYVDTLVEWADQLFRRDSIESLNEATQLYMLAWNILGQEPRKLNGQERDDKTYVQLKQAGLDEFSNAMVELETSLAKEAAMTSPLPQAVDLTAPKGNKATGINTNVPEGDSVIVYENNWYHIPHRGLYFCIPQNEKLLGYWKLVADRFFKLRHCLNIEGVYRQLPLYEPPIDPALLVKARAAGLSIADALSAQYNSRSYYRFLPLLQRAVDYANDVRAFGGALLAAMEKRDAEQISLLRSQFEIDIQEAATGVRKEQIAELKASHEALVLSQQNVAQRKEYYGSKEFMNAEEKKEERLTEEMNAEQVISQDYSRLASSIRALLTVDAGYSSMGGHLTVSTGGQHAAAVVDLFAQAYSMGANILGMQAAKAGQTANYKRRAEEWKFQESTAATELKQIEKQVLASSIRMAIAEQELKNHELQIEKSREQLELVQTKFTNKELYDWMVGQLKTLYFQSYQMAFDMAKKAEHALQEELNSDAGESLIRFGYWDNLKQGLLSGEKLHHDLKRMEMVYLERNKRKQEVSQTFSLAMTDPGQLVNLRNTGSCTFTIPEIYLDLAYQNLKNRKVKSVSLTIPAVTGPYTGIHATLSNGTDRISTSSGQNDSGLFQLNFNDERYLPFEGLSPASDWNIEMNGEFRAFDYRSISDVLLHIHYTADVETNAAAIERKRAGLRGALAGVNLTRLFSLKNEFPGPWLEAKQNGANLSVSLTKAMFPFQMQQGSFNLPGEGSSSFKILSSGESPAGPVPQIASIEGEEGWQVNLGQLENMANLDDVLLVVKYTVG
ncbi:MAG TPA: hypothetical protein DIU20_11330, partial [Cryomorphaceae bacterium]|nr:hypothetical protein [Cryomorphaceae bacterium]